MAGRARRALAVAVAVIESTFADVISSVTGVLTASGPRLPVFLRSSSSTVLLPAPGLSDRSAFERSVALHGRDRRLRNPSIFVFPQRSTTCVVPRFAIHGHPATAVRELLGFSKMAAPASAGRRRSLRPRFRFEPLHSPHRLHAYRCSRSSCSFGLTRTRLSDPNAVGPASPSGDLLPRRPRSRSPLRDRLRTPPAHMTGRHPSPQHADERGAGTPGAPEPKPGPPSRSQARVPPRNRLVATPPGYRGNLTSPWRSTCRVARRSSTGIPQNLVD